jgi:D-3-phosphoglycerate dehydrogenase
VIRQLNQLIHEQELNVVGQYLQTNSSVGYVVVDVQGKASRESLESLGQIDETIKHRILY